MDDTAKSLYKTRRAEVQKELERINREIVQFDADFQQQGQTDYGYPGDLARTLETLKTIKLEG